jgi:hypothetical protein
MEKPSYKDAKLFAWHIAYVVGVGATSVTVGVTVVVVE